MAAGETIDAGSWDDISAAGGVVELDIGPRNPRMTKVNVINRINSLMSHDS